MRRGHRSVSSTKRVETELPEFADSASPRGRFSSRRDVHHERSGWGRRSGVPGAQLHHRRNIVVIVPRPKRDCTRCRGKGERGRAGRRPEAEFHPCPGCRRGCGTGPPGPAMVALPAVIRGNRVRAGWIRAGGRIPGLDEDVYVQWVDGEWSQWRPLYLRVAPSFRQVTASSPDGALVVLHRGESPWHCPRTALTSQRLKAAGLSCSTRRSCCRIRRPRFGSPNTRWFSPLL